MVELGEYHDEGLAWPAPGRLLAMQPRGTLLTWAQGAGPGIGVRGYDLTGRRRFSVLGNETVLKVETSGLFAYAITRDGFATIDLERGVVRRRSPSRPPGNLVLLGI